MNERTITIPVPDGIGKQEFFRALLTATGVHQVEIESWMQGAHERNVPEFRRFWEEKYELAKAVRKQLQNLDHAMTY